LLSHARGLGIDTDASLAVSGCSTGTYTALLQPGGEMVLAMADMGVMERFTLEHLHLRRSRWVQARVRVADCNLAGPVLAALVDDSRRSGARLVVVAVSEPKMERLPASLEGIQLLVLNAGELAARLGRPLRDRRAVIAGIRELQTQGVPDVIVTLGRRGVLSAQGGLPPTHHAAPEVEIVDVTGAGDAFAAGVVASLLQHPEDLHRACLLGQRLAALTLGSAASVAPSLSPEHLSL